MRDLIELFLQVGHALLQIAIVCGSHVLKTDVLSKRVDLEACLPLAVRPYLALFYECVLHRVNSWLEQSIDACSYGIPGPGRVITIAIEFVVVSLNVIDHLLSVRFHFLCIL